MTESRLSTEEQVASIWSLGGLNWRELAKRVWFEIDHDDLLNRASELAYNFLLAVFPMMLFLIALFGLFATSAVTLRADFFFYLQQLLPPAAYELLSRTLDEVTQSSGGAKLTFGLLLALYSGSSGTTQLISTLNVAYEVRESRPWIRLHLISLGLTIVMSVLLLAALLVLLLGGQIAQFLGTALGYSGIIVGAWKVLQWALAAVFVVLAFALVYYFGPDLHERHWYWITPGSVIGVALWVAASAALRLYLHFFNSYSKTYGSLGAVIILLLWFYVTGLAFLVGGSVNSVIEHAAAEHGHPEAKPEGRKAA